MKRLQIVFCLIVSLASVQIVAGIWMAGSVAAAADGVHTLFDVVGITIVIAVSASANRRKSSSERRRLEMKGAVAVGYVLICTAVFLVGIGAYRLAAGTEVENPLLMLALGGVGLVVNAVSLCTLRSIRHQGQHIYSAFVHRGADFLSAGCVTAGGAVIVFTDLHWVDSVTTFIIALLLILLARRIFKLHV